MKKIVFYGDSNTYGFDPRGYGGRYPAVFRWVDRFASEIPDSWEVINCGMNGRQVPRLVGYEQEYVDTLTERMEDLAVLVIMLGTNDILLTMEPDADRPIRKMDALLPYLKEKDKGFRIVLVAPMILFPGTEEPDLAAFEEESIRLAGAYRELAKKHQTDFVDASRWDVELAYDGVHISEQGNVQFAEYMREALGNIIDFEE